MNVKVTPEIQRTSIPRVCAICGNTNNLSLTEYKKIYTPPYALLLLLIGLLPGAILLILIRTEYKYSLFCCEACKPISNFTKKLVHFLSMIASIFLMIGGPIIGVILRSWLVGLGTPALAILIAAFAGEYDNAKTPKIIKCGKDFLTFDIPKVGNWTMSLIKK